MEQWGARSGLKEPVTRTRIHRRLMDEGYRVGLTTVRNGLRAKERKRAEAFVPLVQRPGDGAEMDFFKVTARLGDKVGKVREFVLRLMHSARDLVRLWERADQLSLLDAHLPAFEQFEGVPGWCLNDKLFAAVHRRLGAKRE